MSQQPFLMNYCTPKLLILQSDVSSLSQYYIKPKSFIIMYPFNILSIEGIQNPDVSLP